MKKTNPCLFAATHTAATIRKIPFTALLIHYLLLISPFIAPAQCGTCTLTQANLIGAPSSYTIPAGQTLCITSNFCMGSTSIWPGSCSNTSITQLTINGTLKICTGITFSYSGTVVGSGHVQIMSNARFTFTGSFDCGGGLSVTAVDPTIGSGTSLTTAFSSCNSAACEPHFSNGYAPFGVVATGLGYSATLGCSIKGYPNDFLLLPATVSNWKAGWQNDDIVLHWSATGQGNQQFVAEFSADGQQWRAVSGIINAHSGDPSQDYSYTGTGPFAETNYFRLKIIDNSGSYSYTPVLEITGPNQLAAGIVLIPNPVLSTFSLHNNGRVAIVGLRLADNTGQIIQQLPANSNQYHLEKLAPGTYFLLVALADGSQVVKKLTKL